MLGVLILIQVLFTPRWPAASTALWDSRITSPALGPDRHGNFFELAVVAVIFPVGFESGATLATVVGVLIEVPMMLLVVRVMNASKGWYERRAAAAAR